jgi:hypothetical protein
MNDIDASHLFEQLTRQMIGTPVPAEPNEYFPGFFFRISMSSAIFFAGKFLVTRIAFSACATSAIGDRSFFVS